MTYDPIDDGVIFDFETLHNDPLERGVVLSLALLTFNRGYVMRGKYNYDDLLKKVQYIKFDVTEQIKKYKRKVDPDTVRWWGQQSAEVQKSQVKPSKDDVSITTVYQWWVENVNRQNLRVIYTRNNAFDPGFLSSILKDSGHDLPYDHWFIRDTKSTIDGMTWGSRFDDKFIPEGLDDKFKAHDPRHDIAMDIMRLQYLSGVILDPEDLDDSK